MSYLESDDVRHVYFACGLVFTALIFDVLDGRIARWRQQSSLMGRELDSLADVIASASRFIRMSSCSQSRAR